MKFTRYHPLEDQDLFLQKNPHGRYLIYWGVIFVNVILFLFSLSLIAVRLWEHAQASNPTCAREWFSGVLPVPKSLDRCNLEQFHNDRDSIYRGPPNSQVDSAWDHIVKVDPFRIDENTLQALGAPTNSTRYPGQQGGGYMANLAIFHQLHCLKTVWQYTYLQYYKSRVSIFQQPDNDIHSHLDHCVDFLRQAMMCQPDTSIIPFISRKGQDLPYPQYTLPRSCIDFDKLRNWGLEKAV